MNLRSLLLIPCLGILAPVAGAQGPPIFPDLEGQDLLDALVDAYKPHQWLSYADARDELYGNIDKYADSLSGVYSGYTIYMDPTEDPSTWAFDHGINCEHTWPQSKGAEEEPARSDMHHLYPTRANVNSARGNMPFGENPDELTDSWWRLDYDLHFIPDSHIDEYSEKRNNHVFEPREDHKGNVARSMFYFYTMYKDEADAADPNFFDLQKDALRDWHSLDPVTAWEEERSELIGAHQGDKPNPFVIDTTLVWRAYFSGTGLAERGEAPPAGALLALSSAPNPFNPQVTISYHLPRSSRVELVVYNLVGQQVAVLQTALQLPPGEHHVAWDGSAQPSGVYLCRLRTDAGISATRRMLLLK